MYDFMTQCELVSSFQNIFKILNHLPEENSFHEKKNDEYPCFLPNSD